MGILTNLSLFSGAGGLDLGAHEVGGFRTVGYVEWERYAQAVLQSRIRGGVLDDAPIWDDVSSFDGKPYRGLVDCISGGFPCQDVSVAGKQRAKKHLVEGTRSGLWKEYARIIREVEPRFVLVENVAGLLTGGIGDVLRDLASMWFDARWEVLSASDVGAPHVRKRVFILAWRVDTDAVGVRLERIRTPAARTWSEQQLEGLVQDSLRVSVPAGKSGGVSDGLAFRSYRLRCTGNGVVRDQSIPAWERIKEIAGRQ